MIPHCSDFRQKLCDWPWWDSNYCHTGELEAAGTKAQEAEADLASKASLIQSLEEDLLAAQNGAASMGEP